MVRLSNGVKLSPLIRAGVAMPFSCLTFGEKKDYNNPSEVTDKYDLGQIVKSEEFCEIFRAKDKNTLKMYTCKKFLKRDGRKVRKAAKNEILILKMVKHPNILQLVDVFETRKEYFLFLELATGREVFDWILDQGNLKLENLVYYNRLKHSKIVISLSGNPPFYDEADEDDYENHDKNLFRKILSGDYEFDSPYWDDISDSAKGLVAGLMEVEQDQRLTAQEAINHEWISGNAASDKNIKDGKAVRVTTLMKRLRAPEQRDSAAVSPGSGAPASAVTASAAPKSAASADPAIAPRVKPENTPTSSVANEDPSMRCNGETPAPLLPATEARDEQNV
ncbi:hypothetical protein SKAU_G00105480 [Synaphobranchus kaupii]|uniref:Protein kinase domain-containing protein n=1 Tax=Synaphobranchus kaupii TaxID=118154 RepID=A0A9Q1FZE7_SYNKA|nr:hypothetical protein SKAU_G00105480 [Synaphobranchus kaupii]